MKARRKVPLLPATLAVLGGLLVPTASRAVQVAPDPQEEARVLREASALEWRGQTDEAVQTLERLLQRNPTSAGGLFALERMLRSLGHVAGVLPWADRYLAADPQATAPRYLKLRVLVEVDSLTALEEAARAWYGAVPGSGDPYREVARVYREVFGVPRALDVLRDGRETLGERHALALEIGDLLFEAGDEAGAVEEWSHSAAVAGTDLEGLVRRTDRLRIGEMDLIRPLVEALLGEPTSMTRRRAAVRIALAHAAPEEALSVARAAVRGLRPAEQARLLDEIARRAEEAWNPAVSLWALETLSRVSEPKSPELDARLAAAALRAGDTAAARVAQTRLARSLPGRSPERRRVVADLIRVEAGVADLPTLRQRLQGFRAEFPDAPELDGLMAAVTAGLARRGFTAEALAWSTGAAGPESRLERAWLLFGEGRADEARDEIEDALPALAPVRATGVIQLLARLDRVGPAAGTALALSEATAQHSGPRAAVRPLAVALDSVPDEDLSPLLDRAAQLALQAGDSTLAQSFLRRLVRDHEDSPEAPGVLLTLARLQAGTPDGVPEARELLRRLILEHPQAAVAPAARRELEALGRGG